MSDPLATASAAWGSDLPDWVESMARECATASQNRVAMKMGRSAAMISQVLRRKYPGDLAAVEVTFRGVYEAQTIACPSLGRMPSNECQDWRRKARRFSAANCLRVRMYRACNRCARNGKAEK